MAADAKCPKCGTGLSQTTLSGLCAKCLGRLAFGFLSQEHSAPSEISSSLRQVGDYEVLGEIARGGMGVVYKARQISLNRLVALKMVLHGPFSSQEFVQRFKAEAQAAAGLRHPNIVGIYEVGEEDGHHYFSMEYIEGGNLADLTREQPLNVARATRLLKTIAEAVQYAHDRGILHRDLKPSNVLVDLLDQPHITDFGLAKVIQNRAELTITGQTLGSPSYMAPEQAGGKRSVIGPFTDVYSLGSILYHLLAGRPPFQGETIPEVLAQLQTAEPVPPRRLNPSVPISLQTICMKCLQKKPEERYATAGELAAELGRFLANEPINARPVSIAKKIALWCRRRPVPAALTAALVLVILIGLVAVFGQWSRAELLARGEANQRKIAEAQARKMALNLYAADINLASQAAQRGDYGLARRTLAALQPKAGEADLRGFEWYYLWNQCRGNQLAVFTGHAWIITCIAFSKDGKSLVTGSQDGTAKLWDTESRQLIHSFAVTPAAVWSVGFSPEGDRLMTAGTGDRVKFWDTKDFHQVAELPGQMASLSQTGSVMAISHSSPFFWEPSGSVEIWDYRTGNKLKQISGKGRALVLSPDGKKLAAAGPAHDIEIWEVASGEKSRVISTEEPVWSLAFSPDSKRLLVTDWSSEVSLWDLYASGIPQKLKGHNLTVWSAIFSPNGKQIVTTGSDQTIRIWDAATLETVEILRGHGNEVWCAAFTPDGKYLATGGKDQSAMLWPGKIETNNLMMPLTTGDRPICSADGTKAILVTKRGSGKVSRLWDIQTRKELADLGEDNVIGFGVNGQDIVMLDKESGCLEFRSVGARKRTTCKLEGAHSVNNPFECFGFSQDYRSFFSIGASGDISVWDASSGKLAWGRQGPKPPIRAAELAPDGNMLAISLERESSIHLYQGNGNLEMELKGHRDFVSGLAFSPNATNLVTGSMDGTMIVWNTSNGRRIFDLPGHMQEVTDVAFSPDGQTLASIGLRESVKLWHLQTQRELISIDMPKAGKFIEFTGNGRHLAVTTVEDSIQFLDAVPTERKKPVE